MSALSVRWWRAQGIDPAAIQPLATPGTYSVPSQSGRGSYVVSVQFDEAGRLSASSCSCPDFGRAYLRGVPCCKHSLAVAAKLRSHKPAAPNLMELPTVSSLTYDELAWEWCLRDTDGCTYWGSTPQQCRELFNEALRVLAEHSRKSGTPIAELREFRARERDWFNQQADELPY